MIRRYRCTRCGRDIAVKASRNGNDRGWIHSEYATLCALQPAFAQHAEYGVLDPLAYFTMDDREVMVTQWFAGRDFGAYLQTLDDDDLVAAAAGAGGWLHTLHASHGAVASGTPNTADKLEYLTETYGTALLGDPRTRNPMDLLRVHALEIEHLRLCEVPIHGDFKPENLLCDGRRYVGLDIQLRSHAIAAYDLAPFLNHVWLAGHGARRVRLEHRYAHIEAAFLNGYGVSTDEERYVVRWALLYYVLCQLGSYRQRGWVASCYGDWKLGPLLRLRALGLRRSGAMA
ncbi:MAG: aminoglycoside phosphotransferase [Rhodanobacteraceae bacterium]|nr:MAG: aminoglycoside phosphotransferase [Rhodanobacteraceae bacterium]